MSERVESCITTTLIRYWNWIEPSYINDMFQPSLNSRSHMTLGISLGKANTRQQASFSLEPKISAKISSSTKNAKNCGFFHTYSEKILRKTMQVYKLI